MPSTSTMRAEAERPRAADRLLLGTARRSWRGLAVILLAQVGGALTTLLVPYVLADTVDAVLNQQTPASALARLAGVLAADLTLGVLAVVSGTYVVAGATAWLRRRLLGHVLALGIAGRRRHASGDLTTRLINDVEQTSSAAPAIIEAVVAMGLAAGGAVALWLIDVRLVVAFCAGLPLAWLAVRVLVTDLSDLFLRYSRVLGQIAARLSDALGGVRTIRASGTLDRECSRVLAPLPELSQAGYAMWLAERRLASQLGIITPLIHIAVLAVAGFGVSAGRISSGQFVAVGFYVGIALGVLNAADGLLTLAQARAGAWRVVEVLRDEPYPRGTSGLPPGPGALTLRDVTVRGTDDQVILDRLDLCVPPGVAVALIGASGAGKSTLAMVAGGLVVPDSGEVQLDGVP
ncbi:ABC transporter transmembrane domain-containing protein, partial [Streptomyces sp. NPDC000851]